MMRSIKQAMVQDGRYGRTERWSEPISAFSGLKRDFGRVPRGNPYTPGRKVHGLYMAQADGHKGILLHANLEPIGDGVIRCYEEQLGLGLLTP